MIENYNKKELLNSIRTILYNDSLDLQKRIDILKNIPNNNEIVEDIIDELLNQSEIFKNFYFNYYTLNLSQNEKRNYSTMNSGNKTSTRAMSDESILEDNTGIIQINNITND